MLADRKAQNPQSAEDAARLPGSGAHRFQCPHYAHRSWGETWGWLGLRRGQGAALFDLGSGGASEEVMCTHTAPLNCTCT
jgi:hypothetical protein